MKNFCIDIHPSLKQVRFSVRNGSSFTRSIIEGAYKRFTIVVDPEDLDRVKRFGVEYGNDNNSNHGRWYTHCNGYAMDILINYTGHVEINTYRPYGRAVLSVENTIHSKVDAHAPNSK